MEVLEEMSIEDDLKDVKDTLGDHKKVLDDHTDKIQTNTEEIQTLKIDSEVLKERWNNITVQLTRIENNALSTNTALLVSNNSMLQTMNKLVDGNTAKSTNKKEIIIKGLTIAGSIIGVLILGYFAMRGVSVSIPIF